MNPNEFITLAVQLSNNAAEASQRSELAALFEVFNAQLKKAGADSRLSAH